MNCRTCKFVNREDKAVCPVCSEYSAYEAATTPPCVRCEYEHSSKERRVRYCVGCTEGSNRIERISAPVSSEYTGGSVSYYTAHIAHPTSAGVPYTAECNDIIESLGMNYAEGNVFKAVWRMCAARQGKAKAGYTDGLYDAEKVVFFGQRLVEMARRND